MNIKKKYIIPSIILLLVISLSVGFSAFQKQLLIDDSIFHVRLHEDVRVSDIKVQTTSENVVSNYEDFNVSKLYGSVNFPSNNSYILYKLDLTNYGNLKSGLFSVTNNESGTSVQLCDSSASNCTADFKTPICNGNSCTLGSTKEIYVKVISNSSGNKMIDLDFDFEPYHTITYENFNENTSSLQTEIMEKDVYEVTLTSNIVEVGVSGGATASYNTSNHKLTISNVTSDTTVTAKYLSTDISELSYTGNDPDNYVLFGNELYRIITKETINDGYGNTELRTKIIKESSIGNYPYDSGYKAHFEEATIKDVLNNTYYNSLTDTQKSLIDTAKWSYTDYSRDPYNIFYFVSYFALINESDFTNNSSWLNQNQFTMDLDNESDYGYYLYVINNNTLSYSYANVSRDTYPVTYLSVDALVVGGSGTRSNPYILDKKSDGLQSNPTIVSGRTISVNGNNQDLVTVENRVGTVYYSTSTELNSSNYSSASTIIPTANSVGVYPVHYYIPAGNGYKAKKGTVYTIINGRTYTIAYQIGSNVDSIGKNSDTCTTTGSSLTCNVTLPSITASSGYNYAGWHTSSGSGISLNVGDTYTLSADGVTLYANAISINYQNTTTLAYYNTLNEAFSDVANNQTIKVMTNTTETTKATLASTKTGIKLDLNGYSITANGTYTLIENNGSLDIINSINQTSYLNFGTLSSTGGIINKGTLYLNGSNTNNEIILKYTSDSMSSNIFFIVNNSSATLVMNDKIGFSAGKLIGSLSNYGTVTINGGTISSVNRTLNQSTGTITINKVNMINTNLESSGVLNINGSQTSITDVKITSSGTLNISDGTFKCSSTGCKSLVLSGTTLITGGSFSSYGTTMTLNSGSLTILNGEVRHTGNSSDYAIDVSSGSLTIGKNDTTVSTTIPYIRSSINRGININSSATFNYYDGVITSRYATMSRNPDNVPTGYEVVTDVNNNIRTSYLARRLHATIYYNSNTTSGNLTVTSEDVSCDLEGSATSCTIEVPSTITNSVGKYNSTYKGVSSSLSSMYTSSLTINANTTFYAIYSSPVTRYYYSSGYKTNTIYRNEYLISLTEMNSVLNTLEDGSSNYTTSRGPGSSNFIGLSTAQDTTPEYNTVGSAANSDSMTLYTVYQFVLNFQAGANVSAIGSSSATCNVTTSDTSCSVILPTITPNTGYSSVGWSLSNGDTTGEPELSLYTLTNNNRVLYANAVAANYINTTTNEGYTTLKDAFTNVSNNQTIKALQDATESSTATLESGKTGIKLDLNGHTITIYDINNYGTLDIYNSSQADGTIHGTSRFGTITNNGILTLNGTSSSNKVIIDSVQNNLNTLDGIVNNNSDKTLEVNSNVEINNNLSYGIDNYGTVRIMGGTITGTHGISNRGIITISGGTITGSNYGIYNYNNNGTVTISNGTVTSSSYGIYNDGILTMSSGTVSGLNSGIYNTAKATISGGTITGAIGIQNYEKTYSYSYAIGELDISGTTQIVGTGNYGVQNAGTVTMSGGNINGSIGFHNYHRIVSEDDYYGDALITGGTITGETTGIKCDNRTTLTLGTNDSTVSTTSPIIIGANNANSESYYGVLVGTGSGTIFNFYDGVITSASGSGYAISRDPDNIPNGYEVKKTTTSGVESATLKPMPRLMAGSNGDEYSNFLRTNIAKKDIEAIAFTNSIAGHTVNGTTCFDVSKDEDGGVLAWVSDSNSNGIYEITIGANGNVIEYTGESQFDHLIRLSYIYGMQYFDTSNVTNMHKMFYFNQSFTSLDLSTFDTSNVTDMSYMFDSSVSLSSINLSSFDTSKVTNMEHMFCSCHSFTTINVSSFNTSNVTKMNNMFAWISGLTSLNLSNFNTSKVTDMSYMFTSCGNLTSLDLTSFNTSNVVNMSNMFEGSQHIHTIRVSDNFVVTNVTNSSSMFGNCYRLVGSAGTFFDSNYTDKNRAHYDGGSSNPGYFTRENEVTGIFLYNADYNPGTFALGIVTTTCTITSGDSCTLSVPSVVSSSVGKYNSPYKGVADSEIEMNLTSLTVSETKYFLAVYSAPVTVYYYESGYTSATIYRNEYFNQNDEIVSVLSISETGVSNAYVYSGPNGSSFAGISTAQDTTIEYNTVADAANSVSDTVYLVYKYTVNYQIGANVSAIGSTSSSCNITTNDTSCSIVLPSITPNSGYTSVGWSTINGDTTGTPALSLVTINANNITVYANATR